MHQIAFNLNNMSKRRNQKNVVFLLFLVFFFHLQHTEVPRLGVKLELRLPAYTTATVKPYPSCIWDLYHSSWQCWMLNPLSGARDRTLILMDIRFVAHWATMGTTQMFLIFYSTESNILIRSHISTPSTYTIWDIIFGKVDEPDY